MFLSFILSKFPQNHPCSNFKSSKLILFCKVSYSYCCYNKITKHKLHKTAPSQCYAKFKNTFWKHKLLWKAKLLLLYSILLTPKYITLAQASLMNSISHVHSISPWVSPCHLKLNVTKLEHMTFFPKLDRYPVLFNSVKDTIIPLAV